MSYTCYYCHKGTETGHSITVYQKNGIEDRFEVLCRTCYSDWLLSLKG
jgi:uncharacterized CHY-type Zn-finger protein